jgi:hypothetical protein
MSFLTVATFTDVNDPKLLVLRSRLEGEGIQTFIENESVSSLLPIYNPLMGGVTLKIMQKDAHHAQSFIEEYETQNAPQCPNCKSTQITHQSPNFAYMILAFATFGIITFLFADFLKASSTCLQCKYRWK